MNVILISNNLAKPKTVTLTSRHLVVLAGAFLVAAVEVFQPMAMPARAAFGPGGGGMYSPVLNEFTWADERERKALQQAVLQNAESFSRLEQALSRQAEFSLLMF